MCDCFGPMAVPPGVRSLEVTCCGAPVQIEGELDDGRPFYFRSRHMTASLAVGRPGDDVETIISTGRTVGVTFEPEDLEDRFAASWIGPDEASQLLGDLVAELA